MNFIFLAILIPFSAQANYEKAQIEKIVDNLILKLKKGEKLTKIKEFKNFQIGNCEKPKINWEELLMMKASARSISFKFAQGCDVEGSFKPLPFMPFPTEFKLRHLDQFHTYRAENKITASFESKPVITLDIQKGELHAPKGMIKFDGEYKVRINPMKGKEALEEDLGGIINITEAFGKKMQIQRKFKIRN